MKRHLSSVYANFHNDLQTYEAKAPLTAVLFFDLCGSTFYKANRPLSYALHKIYRHNSTIEEVVKQSRGTIVKSLGDGILASFSLSDRRNFKKCLAACRNVLERFDKYNASLADDEKILTKIGMAVGKVIHFEAFDSSGASVNDPQGPTVDIAARLCNMAAPRQVLMDLSSFELARELKVKRASFPRQAIIRSIKGFAEKKVVWPYKWGSHANLSVAESQPEYRADGFLSASSVFSLVRSSQKRFRLPGISNRLYCNNPDLFNLVAEKVSQCPEYTFELVFLNPHSEYLQDVGMIKRTGYHTLGRQITANLVKAIKFYFPLHSNFKLVISRNSFRIPCMQADDILHVSWPFAASKNNPTSLAGMIGGPFFVVNGGSPLGVSITRQLRTERTITIPHTIKSSEHEVKKFLMQ